MENHKSSFFSSLTLKWCFMNKELSHQVLKQVSTYIYMCIIMMWFWYNMFKYWAHWQRTNKANYFGTMHIFFTVNTLSNKKRAMYCISRKPRELKARCYIKRMYAINEYLIIFQGFNRNIVFGEIELNEILLYCMPNRWIKQVFI